MLDEDGIALGLGNDIYYNAGFLGVRQKDFGFINMWRELVDWASFRTGGEPTLLAGQRPSAIYSVDQDALNIGLMSDDIRASVVGKEGMDFVDGGYIMSHAVGATKPWQKNFIRMSLSGLSPSRADKQFWINASYPIPAWSLWEYRRKLLSVKMASGIGRFVRRS